MLLIVCYAYAMLIVSFPTVMQGRSPVCVDHIPDTKKIIMHTARVLGCITAWYEIMN